MTVDEYREKCTMLWDEYSKKPEIANSLNQMSLSPAEIIIQIQFETDALKLRHLSEYLEQCLRTRAVPKGNSFH
jgi:hypothetical protein